MNNLPANFDPNHVFQTHEVRLGTLRSGDIRVVTFDVQPTFNEFGISLQAVVERAIPTCSCTADIEVTDDKIRANFTESTKLKNETEVAQMLQRYPSRKVEVVKEIVVTFKDGKQESIVTQDGVPDWNPQKSKVTLKLLYTFIF
jgi:hypothetical protein